ncbi:MAG: glycosyltransferase family 4 protein [Pseudomonadota bacterium]
MTADCRAVEDAEAQAGRARYAVAFYAPLKPPDHAHPSGDRHVARLLWRALELDGARVHLASRFRAREANGDVDRQRRIQAVGERLADRLVRRYRGLPRADRPDVWFTYHLYYKAPDWLGPRVSKALGIPYVVAEASYAPKRDKEPWRMVHRATGAAISAADAVVALNPDDVACVLPLMTDGDRRVHAVPPFLDLGPWLNQPAAPDQQQRAALSNRLGIDVAPPWLVCTAMMRPGDKRASYELLAAALQCLKYTDWRLLVIGDGAAATAVHAAFAPFADRVVFLGRLETGHVARVLSAADIYVWPAVNEAFGMAFLEAEACGLPVVAGDTRGVPAVVARDRCGLLTPLEPAAIAAALERLLCDRSLRLRMGQAARDQMAGRHGLSAGAAALGRILAPLLDAAGHSR